MALEKYFYYDTDPEFTMINKMIPTLIIMLLLGSAPHTQASTHTNIDFKVFEFASDVSFFDSRAKGWQDLLLETGVSYDESKDPTQRRGTENWEESQSNFLIFPGIVLGILALVFLFNRD